MILSTIIQTSLSVQLVLSTKTLDSRIEKRLFMKAQFFSFPRIWRVQFDLRVICDVSPTADAGEYQR